MQVYENQENVVDRSILEEEKIPFAVLYRVLGGTVKKIVTDHERIIIAHTAAVFPTWIWAPDDVTEDDKEQLAGQVLYVWRDGAGREVSFCDRRPE